MQKILYHLCRSDEWQIARANGRYDGSSQDLADGFIHFSTGRQVEDSARRHRAGQTGLVLIIVDSASLDDAKLRWEPATGGQLFPHLYGPLDLSAVLEVRDLPLGADGAHQFPKLED
jgi:uncharacterized protein (DUF952 family)